LGDEEADVRTHADHQLMPAHRAASSPLSINPCAGTSWRRLAFSDILPPEIDGSASAFVINK
jgi:hypothetical protein